MDDIINKIQEDHPLCGEYADDARYTWPKRWDALIAALRAQLKRVDEERDGARRDADDVRDNVFFLIDQETSKLKSDLATYQLNFSLAREAEKRGEEMFLDAHPEYRERLALPGTDRLVCWLLEQLAAYESRDETWRGKKEMLENDLAKAWERVERAERVWGIVGRMRERVLNRPPGVIIPMWVHDAIEEAEAVRGPEGEDERD